MRRTDPPASSATPTAAPAGRSGRRAPTPPVRDVPRRTRKRGGRRRERSPPGRRRTRVPACSPPRTAAAVNHRSYAAPRALSAEQNSLGVPPAPQRALYTVTTDPSANGAGSGHGTADCPPASWSQQSWRDATAARAPAGNGVSHVSRGPCAATGADAGQSPVGRQRQGAGAHHTTEGPHTHVAYPLPRPRSTAASPRPGAAPRSRARTSCRTSRRGFSPKLCRATKST